ncbi:hypothetical protein D9615_004774 [Tricholomella constricta]|uniref:Ribonuclease H1 N-terminal domain-containing protein n=1 Tax=Tricholomella constricta TaxID=117010 RepID=A0A8H5HGW0_9AGAR|nr:hypothetical protein D9615_004774 [Tricholomella constricta]
MYIASENLRGPCVSAPAKSAFKPLRLPATKTEEEDATFLSALNHLAIDDAVAKAEDECLRGEPDASQLSPTRRKEKKQGYVVLHGRRTGVFRTWLAASAQVSKFEGARFKGFSTLEDAIQAWDHACANDLVGPLKPTPPRTAPASPRNPPAPPHAVPASPRATSASPHAAPASPARLSACSGSSSSSPAHSLSSLAEASARRISNEECYWLVTSGDRPGVYRGLTAARAAAGTHRAPALLKNTLGEGPAAILFVEKYMAGEVHGRAC